MATDNVSAMVDDLLKNVIPQLQAPISIPTFRGVNTSGSQAQQMNVQQENENFRETVRKEQEAFGTATQKQKEAIDAKAKADADAAEADRARAERVAKENAFYRDLFGLTPNDSSQIAILAKLKNQEFDVAMQKLREVQARQGVTFFDNPLEWLMNTIELPNLEQDYNRQADIVNTIQQKLNANIKTAQDAANFNDKSIPTITAEQAKAKADAATAAAEQAKAIADKELARHNIGWAAEKLAKDIAVLGATNQTTQLELQNNEAMFRAKIAAIQVADSHLSRQIKAADLLDKLQKFKSMDIAFEQYDLIMGNPKGTTTRYSFERMSTAQKENIVAIAAGSFGAGPWTAVINFANGRPGPNVSPQVLRLANYLRDKGDSVQIDPMISRGDKAAIAAARDEGLRRNVIAEMQRPKMGELFYELSPSEMLRSGVIPKDSRLHKVLNGFEGQTGPIPTNAVVDAIMLEFKNPTIAGQVVAEYYRKNIELRNSSMNLPAFGLPTLPIYPVKPPGWFTGKALDLTNPAEATKFIIKKNYESMKDTGLGGFSQNTLRLGAP